MENDTWKALFMSSDNPPQKFQLIFSRAIWECDASKLNGFTFTKEELDIAEKKDMQYIGERNGVDCYLQRFFK